MHQILLIFLSVLCISTSVLSNTFSANVKNGYSDISNINIDDGEIIELSGRWKVIFDTIVDPKNILNFQSYLVTVPSLWNENYEIDNFGVATLYVKLKLKDRMESYGIEIKNFKSTFKFYVNGAEIGHSGIPAKLRDGYFDKEEYLPMFFTAKDSVTIVMQIANYTYENGGFTNSVKLSNSKTLMDKFRIGNIIEMFLSSYLFVISFLFFLYAYFFKDAKYSLYSGLISLLILIQNLFMGNQIFSFIIPYLSEVTEDRIQFSGLVLLNLSLVLYLNSYYKNRVNSIFIKFMVINTLILILLLFFIPVLFVNNIFEFLFILFFFVIVYSLYFLFTMISLKEKNAKILFISFIVVFIAGIIDIFNFLSKFSLTNFLVYALVFFSFIQIIMLVIRHLDNDIIKNMRESILKQQNIELINSKKQINIEVENRTKELNDALIKIKESNKSKTEFLSTMSHELRTPMNGIIGMTELLIMDNPTFSQKEYLGIIKESSYTLLKLINEILDLSKLESENLNFKVNSKNLKKLMEELIVKYKGSASKKNISLDLNYDNILCGAYLIDYQRLNQVISILLENAIKFTHRGNIIITVERVFRKEVNDAVKFEVRDTGIGIPSNKLEEIFEKFTQVESGISRSYGGTGLGLNIAQKIIEAFNSKIEVGSILGGGSSFYFIIELKRDDKIG